jgi:hypothetical protein
MNQVERLGGELGCRSRECEKTSGPNFTKWNTNGMPQSLLFAWSESRVVLVLWQRKSARNCLIGLNMTESKITLTHRLQREGNWDKASLFKDDCISRLRAEGKPRKEAQQAAWEEMEQRFPPPPSESEPVALENIPSEWADSSSSSAVDFFSDAMWVYSSLGLSKVQPGDAPSAGAWSLLRWAKRHEDRFFEQILPKVVAKSAKTVSCAEEEPAAKEEQSISELEKLLSGNHLQWEQKAVADTAQAVKDKVADGFTDWQRKFGLKIPHEACESWRLQMVSLSDDLIHAALKYPDEYRTRQGDNYYG